MVGMDMVMEVVVEMVVVEALDVVRAVFIFYQAGLFAEYDWYESGERGCGWCGWVGVGELVWRCGGVGDVGKSVGVGGAGNIGEVGVSSGGNVSVAGGGARWRDCCRCPDGIFGELCEDLPYRLPFMLDISDVFLQISLEGRGG